MKKTILLILGLFIAGLAIADIPKKSIGENPYKKDFPFLQFIENPITSLDFQINQGSGTGESIFAIYGVTSRIRFGETTEGTVSFATDPEVSEVPDIVGGYKFRNIAGAATTVVKSGRGRLVGINVNKSIASSTITVYDNTSAAGTKIATITNPGTLHADQYVLAYNIEVNLGITVITSGADDLTIVYE